MVKMVALVLNLKTSLTIQLCQQRVGGEEIWSTVLIPLTTNVSLKVRYIFNFQKAGFRPLCNKILHLIAVSEKANSIVVANLNSGLVYCITTLLVRSAFSLKFSL